MEIEWTHTREALKELGELLQCRICNKTANDPCSLGSCDHLFCRCCIYTHTDNQCPVCDIPSHAKEIQPNRQINNTIISFHKLMSLLNIDEFSKPDVENVPSKNVKRSNLRNAAKKNTQLSSSESTNNTIEPKRLIRSNGDQQNSPVAKKARTGTLEEFLIPMDGPITSPEVTAAKKSITTTTTTNNFPKVKLRNFRSKLSEDDGMSSSTPDEKDKDLSVNLSRGTSSKSSASIPKKNAKGETPLHLAVIKGHKEEVEMLLKQNVPLNIKDNAGWTPLHEACNLGHCDIVRLLLDRGALVNVPGFNNMTPLHDAVISDQLAIAELLISKGANANLRNLQGSTAHDLVKSKKMKTVLQTTKPLVISNEEELVKGLDTTTEMVLLASGLKEFQRNQLQNCATILNAKIVDDYSNNVTHLVTNGDRSSGCSRTMKYLQSIISGKWIVTYQWVEECINQKKYISENDYEIRGTAVTPKSGAPKLARINRLLQYPGLFSGCHFYFHGPFSPPTPPKNQLMDLVCKGGGVVISREPKIDATDNCQTNGTVPFHASADNSLSVCMYYIIYAENEKCPTKHDLPIMKTLPVPWLLECISTFKLVDPKKFK